MTEPRTKTGRDTLDNPYFAPPGTPFYDALRERILAIEEEAMLRQLERDMAEAKPVVLAALPLASEKLAQLWREEEVSDLDIDCPKVDYETTAAAVLARLDEGFE